MLTEATTATQPSDQLTSVLPRPGQDTDYTQHALNTVVKAAGAAHTQRTANNPGTHPVERSKNICLDWSEKILKVVCRL